MHLAIDPELFESARQDWALAYYLENLNTNLTDYTVAIDANGLRDRYYEIFASWPGDEIMRSHPTISILSTILIQEASVKRFSDPTPVELGSVPGFEECEKLDQQLIYLAALARLEDTVKIVMTGSKSTSSVSPKRKLYDPSFVDMLPGRAEERVKVDYAYQRIAVRLPKDDDSYQWDELWRYLEAGEERPNIEFKQEFSFDGKEQRAKLVKSVMSLANSADGYAYFVVGVQDKKSRTLPLGLSSTSFVRGVTRLTQDDIGRINRDIIQDIRDHCQPDIPIGFYELRHPATGHFIHVVKVPPTRSYHWVKAQWIGLERNQVWIRRGMTDPIQDTASPDEVREIENRKRGQGK